MDAILALPLPAIDPVFGHAAAAGVAAVLLVGALAKLRDPEIFRDAVENYRLVPRGATTAVARSLPVIEGVAGALLLPMATRLQGAMLASIVLLVVTAAVAINLHRGRDRIDCGCGGDIHTPLSKGLVIRNLLLMLLAASAALPASGRPTVWLDLFATCATTLLLLGLYVVATTLLSHQARLSDLRNAP